MNHNSDIRLGKHLEILKKAQKYCAYQERSHKETKQKLYQLGANSNEIEQLMAELIGEDYLNEERFAKAFARGKFRSNKWGKIKIKAALRQKGISPYCINIALKEIDTKEYVNTLHSLIRKKSQELRNEKDSNIKKNKIIRFINSKGFESDIVMEIISNESEKQNKKHD